MWKVKRMKAARIVVLTIAVGAGGVAAYLASGCDDKPAPAAPVAQLQTVDVLVAKTDIGLGQTVKPDDLQWQTWPAATASNSFIRRNDRPEAIEADRRLDRARALHRRRADPRAEAGQGRTARASWPRSCRPACARSRPKSRRKPAPAASSCRTTGSTSILSKRAEEPRQQAAPTSSPREIILTNVRVLAIDQAPKEKDGQNVVVGKTATLELKPGQAETLARARQSGTLSLALRSIADVNMVENRTDDAIRQAKASMSFATASPARQTTEVIERTHDMKCRGNQPTMRPFMVRALSFSAVAALTLNPALTPVVASDYRVAAPVAADGQMNARFLSLGVGKSVVIDLPRDIKDVLVADPKIANAVVRSAQRAYIIGVAVGQTNIVFFDSAGQQIAGLRHRGEARPQRRARRAEADRCRTPTSRSTASATASC